MANLVKCSTFEILAEIVPFELLELRGWHVQTGAMKEDEVELAIVIRVMAYEYSGCILTLAQRITHYWSGYLYQIGHMHTRCQQAGHE